LGMNEEAPSPLDLPTQTAVLEFTLRLARPLLWHDASLPFPKKVRGASCFFMRFDRGLIGVTADHVIGHFAKARRANAEVVCQVKTAPPFDLLGSIIARDPDLDVATFRATDDLLRQSGADCLDCRENWPPPVPDVGRALSVCGFPEHIREVVKDDFYLFQAWGALPAVDHVTDRTIVTTFDPSRDMAVDPMPKPPLGTDLSG
jgi:hypothetical protein